MIDLPNACPACGAAVYDEDAEMHDKFHRKLDTLYRRVGKLERAAE